MTSKYHINEKGVPGVCAAKIKCQFGGDAQHYFSPEAAQKAFELSMATETVPSAKKKTTEKPSPVNLPTSGAYDVGTKAERYVHPQGKIVEINPDGSVTAWKNGKIIPTSATADKLRNGHGAWKRDTTGVVTERPVSDASVAAKTAARQDRQLNQIPAKTRSRLSAAKENQPLLTAQEIEVQRDNEERVRKLTELGYPKTSRLDPRKLPGLVNRAPEGDKPRYDGYGIGRAALPTATRVNPHDKPESNEYIQGWDRTSAESVIAILKQKGETRDVYRSILSGHNGTSSDIPGDTFYLSHDQTGANIGNGSWEVVGVYEPRPGGAVIGEIPNQKIPFYVYK